MSARTRSVSQSRTIRSKLEKHNYILRSESPLEGTTCIYETIGPFGSHVFVNMDANNEVAQSVMTVDQSDVQLQHDISLADECCEHLTGYVIIHPRCTVVNHVGTTGYILPAAKTRTIRIVPLLTIKEIEADANNAAINADKVSTMLFSNMIINVCSEMTDYDNRNREALKSATDYFHKQSPILDDAVLQARSARELMIAEPNVHDHKILLADAINTLEMLHDHSITIQAHRKAITEACESFKLLHKDLTT